MSLSRILNDDGPGPQTPKPPVQVSAPIPVRSIEPAFIDTPRRSPPIHIPYEQRYRRNSGGREYNHDLGHERSHSPRYYPNDPLPPRRLTQSPPHWSEHSASSSKQISPALSRGPDPDSMALPQRMHAPESSYDRMAAYEPPPPAHYAAEQVHHSHGHPYRADWQDEAPLPVAQPPMQPAEAPALDPAPRSGGRTRRARASATNKGDAPIEPAPKRRRKVTDEQNADAVHRVRDDPICTCKIYLILHPSIQPERCLLGSNTKLIHQQVYLRQNLYLLNQPQRSFASPHPT